MITAPFPIAPQLGPLAAPSEDEIAAAWDELRSEAVPLSWLAASTGTNVAALEAAARAGELLVIPGPWPMRQSYEVALGYLVPAWQLTEDGRKALPALLAAAGRAGWTSLDLHRFMTRPLRPGEPTPAELLQAQAHALEAGSSVPRRRRRTRTRVLLHRHAAA